MQGLELMIFSESSLYGQRHALVDIIDIQAKETAQDEPFLNQGVFFMYCKMLCDIYYLEEMM